MHKITDVFAVNGRFLVLRFQWYDDWRVYDAYPLFKKGIFSKMVDPVFFNTVHVDVDLGTVDWDHQDMHLDPDVLFTESRPLSPFLAERFSQQMPKDIVNREQLVSASTISKHFDHVKLAAQAKPLFITDQENLDLALLSYSAYTQMHHRISELEEELKKAKNA